MIAYLKTRQNVNESNYLKNAHELMQEDNGIYHLIARLINWLDPIFLTLPDIDSKKIELRGNEGIDYDTFINKMKKLFKNCPELKEVFELKNETIYFNSKLTEDEKVEIRNFVDKHRERKVTNFYIRADKNKE